MINYDPEDFEGKNTTNALIASAYRILHSEVNLPATVSNCAGFSLGASDDELFSSDDVHGVNVE